MGVSAEGWRLERGDICVPYDPAFTDSHDDACTGRSADPDRLARFKREAQVLASLNHPNIAAIEGFEDGPAEAGPYVPVWGPYRT